jgi:hypothetical protein
VVNEVLVVHSSSSPVLVLVGAGGSVRVAELVAEVVKFQPLEGWKEKDEDEVEEGTADEPEVIVPLEEKELLRDALALEVRLEALVMEAEALVAEADELEAVELMVPLDEALELETVADELKAVELMVPLDEALELETVDELAEVMVTEAEELADVTVEVTPALELELVGSSPQLCLTASRAC